MKQISIFLLWGGLSLFLACQSTEPFYTPDMQPEDYFQLAQEKAENGDYYSAINIYFKMKETFPDNLVKNVWATYEIAFLYYKLGDEAKALMLLEELLAIYEQDKRNALPPAAKKLAEIVKQNILNKGQYANKVDVSGK